MENFKNYTLKQYEALKSAFKSLRQNRDLLVFVIFLVLSTALWFLNALRKEYTTTISYPVKYVDYPKNFILLGKPQDKLKLKIRSFGYAALQYHLGKILDPQPLNVSSFKRTRRGDTYGAYVATKNISKSFSDKLSNGVELLEIYPDTLFVYLEKKERKMVEVRFDSELTFEQQFYQSGDIAIKPDSVEIAGPSSLVDSIKFVTTEFNNSDALRDSLVRNVGIRTIDNIEINPNRVVVNIPVEPFTQKKLRIPIGHLNLPDSVRLKTFPGDINIAFTVAASRFNKITAQDFSAFVDFNQNKSPGLPDRLKVKLVKQPEGIKSVTYSPLFVDCLFERERKK